MAIFNVGVVTGTSTLTVTSSLQWENGGIIEVAQLIMLNTSTTSWTSGATLYLKGAFVNHGALNADHACTIAVQNQGRFINHGEFIVRAGTALSLATETFFRFVL